MKVRNPFVLFLLFAKVTIIYLIVSTAASAQLPSDEEVPKVTAYDAKGAAFPFQEKMKGHYSVIVFGCLT